MRFSSRVMRAVGGIARPPRRRQRHSTETTTSATCLWMRPRLCMSRAMRFSYRVMLAVGSIARHPRRPQRDTARRLLGPNLQNKTCNKTQWRIKSRSALESVQRPWHMHSTKRLQERTSNIPQWDGTPNSENTIGRRCCWTMCLESLRGKYTARMKFEQRQRGVHAYFHHCKKKLIPLILTNSLLTLLQQPD